MSSKNPKTKTIINQMVTNGRRWFRGLITIAVLRLNYHPKDPRYAKVFTDEKIFFAVSAVKNKLSDYFLRGLGGLDFLTSGS